MANQSPKLKVAILGCGHIAATHAAAWKRSKRFQLAGFFDVESERAATMATHFSVSQSSPSLQELFETCDVIDICTPPSSHADLIRRALDFDRHLFVEKPAVIAEADWNELLPRLRDSERSFSVVHNLKFTRMIQTSKRILDSGRIGKLLRLEWHFMTDPSVDRMLGGRPHWSHELPGGRWFETLPHNLYMTYFLRGPMELAGVEALATDSRPRGTEADELAITLADADCMCVIHLSSNCTANHRWGKLVGSEGILQIDILSGAVSVENTKDSPSTRAASQLFLNSLAQVAAAPGHRLRYAADRLRKWTPHARLVEALAAHLDGTSGPPTPIQEVDYVIRQTHRVGRAIDLAVRS